MDNKVMTRLAEAMSSGAPVRVHRSAIRDADRLDGFVVAAGAAWTLIAVCSDIQLDGWAAVRTADTTKVGRRGGTDCLTVRALRRRGRRPARAPEPALALDGLAELAEDASRAFGLVSLHAERDAPDACWIGEVAAVRPKSLRLREVDTEARWLPELSKFPFEVITRVGFGGRYERTLLEFAGPYR
ncbi:MULTISPECIES: hypothetical protein [unclassified Streptomyces]|uniref:hypothetical protein n=1 Tax=unclassified Streptomyces TaxID=2593676 RepID=UPI0004C68D27|nr:MULTISPECIES: hypothetical protein [unclassified Streptomyces]